jgi:hypothetical protein
MKMDYISRKEIVYDDTDSQGEDDLDTEAASRKESLFKLTKLHTDPNAFLKGNARFKNYKQIFDDMLKEQRIITMYPIITCMISLDSTRVLIVCKKGEREYCIQMFDLESYKKTFDEKIGGSAKDYIKIKDIEQNSRGDFYAITYFNDGKFKMRYFGKEQRSEENICKCEVDINALLGIDDWTMAIEGFSDPYIVCCFIDDNQLFVALYHNFIDMHFHFIYDIKKACVVGEPVSIKMNSNKKNFPYKAFYNDELREVYLFYRQGQSFIIDPENPREYLLDKMTEMDLGQMYLIYNQALVTRSSNEILFFKIKVNDITGRREWK